MDYPDCQDRKRLATFREPKFESIPGLCQNVSARCSQLHSSGAQQHAIGHPKLPISNIHTFKAIDDDPIPNRIENLKLGAARRKLPKDSDSKPHANSCEPARRPIEVIEEGEEQLNEDEEQTGNLSRLASKVKSRLSLPDETPIPESILQRLIAIEATSDGDQNNSPSRNERRRSLLEIGFGKLSTYEKLHVLGSGTYSTVYKGASKLTDKLVALKEIYLERDEGVPFTAIREASLLKELRHNNIITLHDIICTSNTLTLVFEYVERDLSQYMERHDHKIHIDNVKLFLFQLLRGLKYCHDRRILHRDLKPQNILISQEGELKLADFGLARAKSVPTKTFTDEVVTLWYRPPDVLLGNVEYNTSIDMWGVGCIFFEMVAGFTMFTGTDPKKQIKCIFDIIGTPRESDWPGIKADLESISLDVAKYPGRDLAAMAPRLDRHGLELLKKFLICNPRSRISSSDAMHHQYFETFPKEIYDLCDTVSVFTVPGIKLLDESSLKDSLSETQAQ